MRSDTEQTPANTSKPAVVAPASGEKWNIFGLEIAGKIMSEQTEGEYAVIVSNTPPQGGPPLHLHQYEDELFYVVQGEYIFTCGGKK